MNIMHLCRCRTSILLNNLEEKILIQTTYCEAECKMCIHFRITHKTPKSFQASGRLAWVKLLKTPLSLCTHSAPHWNTWAKNLWRPATGAGHCGRHQIQSIMRQALWVFTVQLEVRYVYKINTERDRIHKLLF